MPFNPLISTPAQSKALLANAINFNDRSPYLVGVTAIIDSPAGTILYGANSPGDLAVAKAVKFRAAAGQTAFEMPAAINVPQNTTGGALAIASQLRVTALVNDATPLLRVRGDLDPAAGQFAVGAGGGTMTGDATMTLNAATPAGSTSYAIKSSGANTKTMIIGDRMTITEGGFSEQVTIGRLFTANGTTAVTVFTSPTTVAYTVAAVLTFQAASGKAISIGTAAVAGADYTFYVLDAADVVTVGAASLNAGQVYDAIVTEFMTSAALVNLKKSLVH